MHLTRQFRYAVGRDTLEVPSGTLEPGEDPLEGAKRELREELGIQAGEWRHLGQVDIDTSIEMCPVDLFIAQQLHFTGTDRDSTELIQPSTISLESSRAGMALGARRTFIAGTVLLANDYCQAGISG